MGNLLRPFSVESNLSVNYVSHLKTCFNEDDIFTRSVQKMQVNKNVKNVKNLNAIASCQM